MSSVIERIRKRKCYPVELPSGETVHVSGLSANELLAVIDAGDSQWVGGYVVGHGLRDENGTRAFTPSDGETSESFGQRVITELDADIPTLRLLVNEIQRVSAPADQDKLEKN